MTATANDAPCVLITGVSTGIGHALAAEYLNRGAIVYGLSRRTPDALTANDRFHFQAVDLADYARIAPAIHSVLRDVPSLHLIILNAGLLGPIADVADTPLDDFKQLMDVNVWANKGILDAVFARGIRVRQVVAISSGAAVNGNRGWGAYSISKAALNMLTKLYARERPDTHFCAFAPGLIDTSMQDYLCDLKDVEKFPSLGVIQSKRNTPAMPKPPEAAKRFVDVFPKLPDAVPSGEFTDIRKMNL
jgi:benzil reductase ((S)-benzoin forming)